MLGVEIEFGNHWTPPETSSYKPTKAKTPERRGFYKFSGGSGRNQNQVLRTSILIETFGEIAFLG